MSDTAYLALLLDGPLQSWGMASRFQRRNTGLHPTKSGVVGLICAAMGLHKGSSEELELLPQLARLHMTSIAMPRGHIQRLDDFHTTGGGYSKTVHSQFIPRKASGKTSDNPTVSRRQYLLDARFGVILAGPGQLLRRAQSSLKDPVWGVWLGRKNCIPAEPIGRGLFDTEADALRALIGDRSIEEFTCVTEMTTFSAGTDSLNDQPVSFGDGTSSGVDARRFAIRRIVLKPASEIRNEGRQAHLNQMTP
jgi:CRISPR system Cascade subunit CasD